MSCNILYIEDDVSLALTISYILGQAGHNVTVAHTAAEGIQLFRSIRPQFLLLDVQLPDMSGHRIAEMLQRNNELANCFLIFISGRGVETEIIKSLTCYADEFLLKPLDPRILIAKIQALHRRKNISYTQKTFGQNLELMDLTIVPEKMDVLYRGNPLSLTRTEYAIFKLLYGHPNKVLTRDYIINNIRGQDFSITHRIIDFQICQLRRKLGIYSENIETVRGKGYRMKVVSPFGHESSELV